MRGREGDKVSVMMGCPMISLIKGLSVKKYTQAFTKRTSAACGFMHRTDTPKLTSTYNPLRKERDGAGSENSNNKHHPITPKSSRH